MPEILEKPIQLTLAKVAGVPKLCVKCSSEYTHIVTTIKGGIFSKKYNTHFYPLSAVYHFFSENLIDEISYSESVYEEFDKQRNAFGAVQRLVRGEQEPDEHPFLMHHQRVAVEISKLFDRWAFFMDTGTGKTLTALEIMQQKGGKWLVVVPRPIIRTGWVQDGIDFFPQLRIAPMSLNYSRGQLADIANRWGIKTHNGSKVTKALNAEKLREILLIHSDVVVINPESINSVLSMAVKENIEFTGCIVDESTRIKNPKAKITETVHKIADNPKVSYFYIMTGEPRPQSEEDYWAQMYCIDKVLLGDNFYGFRGKYFNRHPWLDFKYIFKEDMAQELSSRIAMKSYTVKKSECLDLLEPVTIVREVELSAETRKMYKQMEKDFFTIIEDTEISALAKVSALAKLRQIPSGFLIDTRGGTTFRHSGNEKVRELQATLDELGREPVVIWISYREEARIIEEALGAENCAIANGAHDTDEALRRFMSNEVQYLIAHPASIRYGVTLTGRNMVRNCSYAIYFSKDNNYENFYQSKDRIQRIGQTVQVTYIHIIAVDTIDALIHEAVKTKQNTSEFFSDIITKRSRGELY